MSTVQFKISKELRREFKIVCAELEMTMQDKLISLIQETIREHKGLKL